VTNRVSDLGDTRTCRMASFVDIPVHMGYNSINRILDVPIQKKNKGIQGVSFCQSWICFFPSLLQVTYVTCFYFNLCICNYTSCQVLQHYTLTQSTLQRGTHGWFSILMKNTVQHQHQIQPPTGTVAF
jgi:hypothetical protein